MSRVLYVNPDPGTVEFGNSLGCGWVPDVPAQYADVAEAPCVIISGCGQVVVLSDDGTLTPDAVAAILEPIIEEELAVAPGTVTVQIDVQAMAEAQAAVRKATTVKALSSAVQDALALLAPTVT